MGDIDDFRQAVESFIAQRGWTATRFGRTNPAKALPTSYARVSLISSGMRPRRS